MSESPIHVCILTSAHAVDDMRVNHKFGRTLLDEGFRVTWVGPDYAYFDEVGSDENGYDYRLFPSNKYKSGRLVGYLKARRYGSRVRDVDIYYAPDPDSAAIAVRLARRNGARVIFDIHELYHDRHLKRWVRGRIGRMARDLYLNRLNEVCRRCDLVIGVSEGVLEPLRGRPNNRMIIRSCAPAWFAETAPAEAAASPEGGFTIIHGKADLDHSTDVILDALSIARNEIPSLKCIMFDFFLPSGDGFGRDEFCRRVAALDLGDVVDFRPTVPMEKMPAVASRCHAGLIAINHRFAGPCIPNRLFEYMAVGLPTLVPEYAPEIMQIVNEERCSATVDFENPQAVAAAMVWLYRHPQEREAMGRRAREAFLERHNWQVEVQPLLRRIRSWCPERTASLVAAGPHRRDL